MREDDGDRADAFPGPNCVCTLNCLDKDQLAELASSVFDFCGSFANLASYGAICARGGVLKFIHVVNNDTSIHAVHACTVAFSTLS